MLSSPHTTGFETHEEADTAPVAELYLFFLSQINFYSDWGFNHPLQRCQSGSAVISCFPVRPCGSLSRGTFSDGYQRAGLPYIKPFSYDRFLIFCPCDAIGTMPPAILHALCLQMGCGVWIVMTNVQIITEHPDNNRAAFITTCCWKRTHHRALYLLAGFDLLFRFDWLCRGELRFCFLWISEKSKFFRSPPHDTRHVSPQRRTKNGDVSYRRVSVAAEIWGGVVDNPGWKGDEGSEGSGRLLSSCRLSRDHS